MTDYREILRLYSQGISQRSIAVSCGCSRNTVSTVLVRASQQALEWDQVGELTNSDLFQRLYPEKQQELSSRSIPDCEHIHRELARSYHVVLSRLSEKSLTSQDCLQMPVMKRFQGRTVTPTYS